MEYENENQEEINLIDIFYKDTERLNSIISQINKGTLQNLTTKSEDLQGSTFNSGGKLGIAGSGLECNQQSKEENKRIIEENRLIQDYLTIDLLNNLNLETLTCISDALLAKLVVVEGTLALQNYKAVSSIIPLVSSFSSLMKQPELNKLAKLEEDRKNLNAQKSADKTIKESLNCINAEIKALKDSLKQQDEIFKCLPSLSPILPKNIGFNITLEDNHCFKGVLKENFLIDNDEILFATYNSNLPGKWKVLGIIDSINNKLEIQHMENFKNNPLSAINGINSFFRQLVYPQKADGIIKPILIFRDLNV